MSLKTVYTPDGTPANLGSEIGGGGEGTVYEVQTNTPNQNNILVKIYHNTQKQKTLEKKIDTMRVMPIRDEKFISWPISPVFDVNKNWVGYAMRRISGVPAFYLAHPYLYNKDKYFPNANRGLVVNALIDLLKKIDLLHKEKVFIGDYNLNNIFFDPKTYKAYLIDCDSYQVKGFPCPVGSPDMTPKEHQGKKFDQITRTLESEYFSIAIVLFKCLMLGRHPYDIVGGADPVENLKNGNFPYGKGKNGKENIPKGNWYNIWSWMPHYMKNCFIQTFTDGADNPKARVTTKEWIDNLTRYRNDLNKGYFGDGEMCPQHPKSSEYNGSKPSLD